MIVGRSWRRILPKLRPHRRFIRVAEQVLIKTVKNFGEHAEGAGDTAGRMNAEKCELALGKRRRPRNALLDEPSIKKENSVIS